jgi:hypothetical protein
MLHTRFALPATLWASVSVVELLRLLTLQGLVHFGGGQSADFVSNVFDFGPSHLDRRPLLPELLLTDQLRQFGHFGEYGGRPSISASFDFRCHEICPS